jgi:hypothetical protein
VHEFSVGTLTEGNAFNPPKRENSTDPEGMIDQRWTTPGPVASFLEIASGPQDLTCTIRNSLGAPLYTFRR